MTEQEDQLRDDLFESVKNLIIQINRAFPAKYHAFFDYRENIDAAFVAVIPEKVDTDQGWMPIVEEVIEFGALDRDFRIASVIEKLEGML